MSAALRASLAANLLLAVLVAVLLGRSPAEARRSAADPLPGAGASSLALSVADEPDPSAAGSPAAKLRPEALLDLERLGIPRSAVVAALLDTFHRRWDLRFTELQRAYAPRQVPEREWIELGRLRAADQVRELKETLGEEGYVQWDRERTLQAVNPAGAPMTPAEAERAYRLRKDFEEKHAELQMAMEDGVADRADAAALQARAQEALDRELETLLGKERYEQMRGFTSPVAEVQRIYGDLNPSLAQAEAVVRAEDQSRRRETELAGRVKEGRADPAALAAELKVIQETREQELRRVFGADAYETMKRQTDPTYRTLQQYAGAWGLGPHELPRVYSVLRDFHADAERMRLAAGMRQTAGQPVDWREVDAAIDAARRQTEAGLTAVLGGERLHRLKQNELLTRR